MRYFRDRARDPASRRASTRVSRAPGTLQFRNCVSLCSRSVRLLRSATLLTRIVFRLARLSARLDSGGERESFLSPCLAPSRGGKMLRRTIKPSQEDYVNSAAGAISPEKQRKGKGRATNSPNTAYAEQQSYAGNRFRSVLICLLPRWTNRVANRGNASPKYRRERAQGETASKGPKGRPASAGTPAARLLQGTINTRRKLRPSPWSSQLTAMNVDWAQTLSLSLSPAR
jgi:hypothetical protein